MVVIWLGRSLMTSSRESVQIENVAILIRNKCNQERTFSLRWMRSKSSPFSAYSRTMKMSLLVSMNSKCLIMCGWLKRRKTLISLFTFSNTPCILILRLFKILIATRCWVISLTATRNMMAQMSTVSLGLIARVSCALAEENSLPAGFWISDQNWMTSS